MPGPRHESELSRFGLLEMLKNRVSHRATPTCPLRPIQPQAGRVYSAPRAGDAKATPSVTVGAVCDHFVEGLVTMQACWQIERQPSQLPSRFTISSGPAWLMIGDF
jgi:hypothetical protein